METSILNGMCRCCALEGTFKDLKCTYHWMGEQEIYGDMLKECFNIDLSNEDGTDSGICEVCITQLRNAVNFKKQVLFTEEQFKKKVQGKFFKANIVKVEVQQDEADSDDNDNNLSTDEAFSNTEFEVPIKMEEPEEPKAKKRAAAKATTSRAKKAKTDAGETSKPPKKKMHVLTLKRRNRKPEKKRYVPVKRKHIIRIERNAEPSNAIMMIKKNPKWKNLENLLTVLKHSNATPIKKYGGIGYTCSYCDIQYTEAAALKEHTLEAHKNGNEEVFLNSKKPFTHVKLDVTDLTCSICQKRFVDLQLFIEHLVMDHQKNFYRDVPPHMIPFKFDSSLLKCLLCKVEYGTFKMLLVHMNSHFENFVCDVCGKGFIAKSILQTHLIRHRTGVFKCAICDKNFNTLVKQKEHTRAVHILHNKRSRCGYCGEKFSDYTQKNDHVVKKHGGKLLVLQCHACEKTYDNQRSMNHHIKKCHSIERRKAQ